MRRNGFLGSGWAVACAAWLIAFESSAQSSGQLPPAPSSPPSAEPPAKPPSESAPTEQTPAPPTEPAPVAPKAAAPPAGHPPGYPPPGYPPGYPPPPGWAPPGYGGYPYGYPPPGYYPPAAPRRERPPSPQYPDEAAARTSPFIEMLIGGQNFSKRFASYFNVGLQLGMFIAARVRIAGRILMFPADPDDEFASDTSFSQETLAPGFYPMPSEPAAFLFGGSVGFALARTPNFVLAPSVVLMSNDQADEYGSFLGVGIPFDWVTDSGLRVGFEVTVGRGFDGTVKGVCQDFTGSGVPTRCDQGEIRAFDREAGAGFYSHFHLGWGFDRPRPTYAVRD